MESPLNPPPIPVIEGEAPQGAPGPAEGNELLDANVRVNNFMALYNSLGDAARDKGVLFSYRGTELRADDIIRLLRASSVYDTLRPLVPGGLPTGTRDSLERIRAALEWYRGARRPGPHGDIITGHMERLLRFSDVEHVVYLLDHLDTAARGRQ